MCSCIHGSAHKLSQFSLSGENPASLTPASCLPLRDEGVVKVEVCCKIICLQLIEMSTPLAAVRSAS